MASYYCSSSGSDANDGLTSATPKATLTAAYGLMASGDTCYVDAPLASPLRGQTFGPSTNKIVTFRSLGGDGVPWYIYGSELHGSGWTNAGGGIYSKDLGWAPTGAGQYCFVTTMTMPSGFSAGVEQYRIAYHGSQTTTPAANTWSFSATTIYVNMPSGADPNSNPLEIQRQNSLLGKSGHGGNMIYIDAVSRYSRLNCFSHTGGGLMTCLRCVGEYGDCGFATNGLVVQLDCTECVGRFNVNDGFNIHGTTGQPVRAILTRCDGSYNYDEGCSPHDDTRMWVIGGQYHHNAHGGMTAILRAEAYLQNVHLHHNYGSGPEPANEAAVTYQDVQTTGSIIDCEIDTNYGKGIYVNPSGVVVGSGAWSHDNVTADVYSLAVTSRSTAVPRTVSAARTASAARTDTAVRRGAV